MKLPKTIDEVTGFLAPYSSHFSPNQISHLLGCFNSYAVKNKRNIIYCNESGDDIPKSIRVYGVKYFRKKKSKWVKWNGGECPVEKHVRVRIKNSHGNKSKYSQEARFYRWQYCDRANIIAYKIVKEKS